MNKESFKRVAGLSLASLFTMMSYQNCGPGYSTMSGSPYASGLPGGNSGMLPPPTISKSHIYVGGSGGVSSYLLNHETGSLTPSNGLVLSGQTPGWFSYDSSSNTLFVADANGGNLNLLRYAPSNGGISLDSTVPFQTGSVHLEIEKSGDKFLAYGASYNLGEFSEYTIDPVAPSSTLNTRFQYTAGAHSHSSSIDLTRGLIFVANKDEERIVVYKKSAAGITLLTSINVLDPRIVLYNEHYDRLYVTTEADNGASAMKIYSIDDQPGGTFAFSEIGSFSMGLRGSDLKIDRFHGYAVTTVREANKEGIWALPLTSAGLLDTSRDQTFIPVTQREARSLQITADGKYYILTCNNASNIADLLIFRVDYDAEYAIEGFEQIHAVDVGAGSFPSNFVISEP